MKTIKYKRVLSRSWANHTSAHDGTERLVYATQPNDVELVKGTTPYYTKSDGALEPKQTREASEFNYDEQPYSGIAENKVKFPTGYTEGTSFSAVYTNADLPPWSLMNDTKRTYDDTGVVDLSLPRTRNVASVGDTVTFNLEADPNQGDTGFWLHIGTGPGLSDILDTTALASPLYDHTFLAGHVGELYLTCWWKDDTELTWTHQASRKFWVDSPLAPPSFNRFIHNLIPDDPYSQRYVTPLTIEFINGVMDEVFPASSLPFIHGVPYAIHGVTRPNPYSLPDTNTNFSQCTKAQYGIGGLIATESYWLLVKQGIVRIKATAIDDVDVDPSDIDTDGFIRIDNSHGVIHILNYIDCEKGYCNAFELEGNEGCEFHIANYYLANGKVRLERVDHRSLIKNYT